MSDGTTITTGDPDRDYELGWNYSGPTPRGASSDFAQGVSDRGWAITQGRSTALEDSPRWRLRKRQRDAEERRAREVAYMTGGNPHRAAVTDPEHVTEDTLPEWLFRRFGAGFKHPDEYDPVFWAHEAAAVRRAVARGGFKR